jgi:hypothetical protein
LANLKEELGVRVLGGHGVEEGLYHAHVLVDQGGQLQPQLPYCQVAGTYGASKIFS